VRSRSDWLVQDRVEYEASSELLRLIFCLFVYVRDGLFPAAGGLTDCFSHLPLPRGSNKNRREPVQCKQKPGSHDGLTWPGHITTSSHDRSLWSRRLREAGRHQCGTRSARSLIQHHQKSGMSLTTTSAGQDLHSLYTCSGAGEHNRGLRQNRQPQCFVC
jgi:hypothetical protein